VGNFSEQVWELSDERHHQTESSLKKAPLAVCGDAACGAGVLLAKLEVAGADIAARVQFSVTPGAGSSGAGSVSVWVSGPGPARPASLFLSEPQGWWWYRGLRRRLHRLPVGCPVHDREDRAHYEHRRLRGRVDPGHSAGSGVAGRVPGRSTAGRVETWARDAPPARRQAGTCPRSDQGWCRFRFTGGCGGPGPVRRAHPGPGSRARVGSGPQSTQQPNPQELMAGPLVALAGHQRLTTTPKPT
jgi:hypothetical protein